MLKEQLTEVWSLNYGLCVGASIFAQDNSDTPTFQVLKKI